MKIKFYHFDRESSISESTFTNQDIGFCSESKFIVTNGVKYGIGFNWSELPYVYMYLEHGVLDQSKLK